MAKTVTTSTQLSTFDTIKSIFRKSSTLNLKFTTNDYYEWEPKHKSAGFKGYPYIVINVPNTDLDDHTFDRSAKIKPFTVDILLVMEYEARDNFKTYANAMIDIMEQNISDLETIGYYNTELKLIDTDLDTMNQKELVVGTFELTMTGVISR